MKKLTALIITLAITSCINVTPLAANVNRINQTYQDEENQERQEIKVLTSNKIRSLSDDISNLWIATDQGVSRFNREDNRWTSYTKEDGLVSDDVYVVVSDNKEVWFGTDNGVSRFQPAKNEWTTYRQEDGLISNKVNCIAIDSNYVWIGTDEGLSRYDRRINSWASRVKEDGLTSDIISAIAVEKEYVWAGTKAKRRRYMGDWEWKEEKRRSGVNRYAKNTDSWNTYTPEEGMVSGEVSTIAIDERIIWFGTSDAGISCYSKSGQTFVKSYTKSDLLSTNNIKCIIVDGNYTWIGTANSGVYRYIKTTDSWMQYKIKEGLASDHITSIAVHGNEVWFGTYENGVSRYNKLTQEWTTYTKANYLADNDVRAISIHQDEVWAATTRGLSKYDIQSGQWTNFGVKDGLTSNYITRMETYGDEVFIAMEDGKMARWQDGKRARWPNGKRASNLLAISPLSGFGENLFVTYLKVHNGKLWIGTARAGVFRLSLDSEDSLEKIVPADKLPNPIVTSIVVDESILWIGTQGGLCRYKMEENHGQTYTVDDGLASNHINTILQDGDVFWIGTFEGLSRFRYASHSIQGYDVTNNVFQTFTMQDGLPNNNIRALALKDDVLWIGTPKGLGKLSKQGTKYSIGSASFSEEGYSFHDNIRSIGIRENTLWLATAAGVVKFDRATDTWQAHRPETERTPFIEAGVSNIEFDGKDVWLSNWTSSLSGCIARFDRISKSWLRYTVRDILHRKQDAKTQSIASVTEIVPQLDYVWFATDYGVLRYDKEQDTWRHYTTAEGLVDNSIRFLVSSGDTVWVGGSGGRKINKYDKKSDRWMTIRFRNPHDRDENPIERSDEWRFEEIERREREDRGGGVRDFAVTDGSLWLIMDEGITFFDEYTKMQRRYSTEDGLASNRMRCIEYDGRYVWVGHESWDEGQKGGVSRYDTSTSTWTTYSMKTVLSSDRIDQILISQNYVWFLPERHSRSGATGYDIKRDDWFILEPRPDSEDEHNDRGFEGGIVEVMDDGQEIWVGTSRNGILKFHTASDAWTLFRDRENIASNIVTRDGFQVDENYVWAGTLDGLRLYDKKLETWTNYTKPVTLTGDEVRTIAVDERYVWCGTSYGIFRYDKIEDDWIRFKQNGGRQVIKVGNDTYDWWQEESEEGLVSNQITGLAVDEHYLWVATQRGANRYDRIADIWDRYTDRQGLPSRNITAVTSDGSDVWMGTGKGLSRYPRMSDDPNAWITYTTMIEIKPMVLSEEYASSLVSNKIRAVAAEKDYIWVGTERGVSRYDKKRDMWQTYTTEDGLIDDKVSCIAVDENSVWFGTARGVTMYSKKSHDWINFTTENGLPSNQVTCIAIDGNKVWFGTFDAGLAKYDQKIESWMTFTEKNGLAHSSVLSMALDENFCWFGTRRGLSRYDKQTNAWTTYTEYE